MSFSDAYRAVQEYRQRYPEKAVVYYAQNYPEQAWAILMAGGSGAGVKIADTTLRKQLVTMHVEGAADREDAKVMQSDNAALVYGLTDGTLQLSNLTPGTYLLNEIDRQSGQPLGKPQRISVKSGTCTLTIAPNRICWVRHL